MLKEKHLLTFTIFPLQMSNSFCISAKDRFKCRQSYGLTVEESGIDSAVYMKHCG